MTTPTSTAGEREENNSDSSIRLGRNSFKSAYKHADRKHVIFAFLSS